MLRRSTPALISIVCLLVAGRAWAQDDGGDDPPTPAEPTTESDGDSPPAAEEPPPAKQPAAAPPGPAAGGAVEPAPTAAPLAVPADPSSAGPAGAAPSRTGPRSGVRPAPGSPNSGAFPATYTSEPSEEPAVSATKTKPEPYFYVDAGYRMVWIGNVTAPTRDDPVGGFSRPQLIHGQFAALLDKNVMVGLTYEMAANPKRGHFPFVGEARIGWWDNAFGRPAQRGPINTLPGVSMTYVGWRWIHDHYRGAGGEWAGTADVQGLVLGYSRAANFGKLTVVTDSQFSLYLVGWKERSEFPLGLLNQRLSVGWDPVFIDARFKSDPGTGSELSVGVSFQTILGPKQDRDAKAR